MDIDEVGTCTNGYMFFLHIDIYIEIYIICMIYTYIVNKIDEQNVQISGKLAETIQNQILLGPFLSHLLPPGSDDVVVDCSPKLLIITCKYIIPASSK